MIGRMYRTRFLTLIVLCGSIPSLPATEKSLRLGNLLISVESLSTVDAAPLPFSTGTAPRRAREGYRLVQVTVSVTNLGKHLVCTRLKSTLDTPYGNTYAGDVKLGKAENVIDHLAPDHQLRGSVLFEIRNGTNPEGISFGQIGNTQGCSRESDFVRPTEVRLSLRR